MGLALISLAGLLELGLWLFYRAFPYEDPYLPKGYPPPAVEESSVLMPLIMVIGTTFLPAFLLLQGHSARSRVLRVVAKSWLILESVFLLGLCFLDFKNGGGFEPVLVGVGAPLLIGAILLDSER